MLTTPDGFSTDALASALARGWGLTIASLDYGPSASAHHCCADSASPTTRLG